MAELFGLVASIVTVLDLSAKVLGYINAVKDAGNDRARCGLELANLHGLLEKLKYRAQRQESADSKAWRKTAKGLAKQDGLLDQFKRALQRLERGLEKAGKFRWKFQKEEIQDILGHLERLKSYLVASLQMDHFELSTAIKDDTKHVPYLRSIIEDSDRKAFINWISSSNHPAEYESILQLRQSGTAEWFTSTPKVKGWLAQAKTTLLCRGNLGTGKSMLAAVMIEYLQKSARSKTVGVTCVFIHREKNNSPRDNDHAPGNMDNVSELLAGLLKQLVQHHGNVVDSVAQLYKKFAKEEKKLSESGIIDALKEAVEALSTVYIVIDALDECTNANERDRLVKHLQSLQSRADVRLMITSRIVTAELLSATKLEVKAHPWDIKRYVVGRIQKLPAFVQSDGELQVKIQDVIAASVGDVFLLATLHMERLSRQLNKRQILQTLKHLPSHNQLDEAYDDVIKRIDAQGEDIAALAKRALSWIVLARRPLTASELCCALAVELETEELDTANLFETRDIQSICAGLVNVEEERRIVGLVHNTAQTFLEPLVDRWNLNARKDIAETCLTYLAFQEFRTGRSTGEKALRERFQKNDFFMYAAEYWSEHLRPVETEIARLACSFLLQKGSYESAAQAMYLMQNLRYVRRIFKKLDAYSYRNMTAAQFVANEGFCGVMEVFLKQLGDRVTTTLNTEAAANRYGTPLAIAAAHEDTAMIELLIRHGSRDGEAVLQKAIRETRVVSVRHLLDLGITANAVDSDGHSALINAVTTGSLNLVQLLLDRHADIRFCDSNLPNGTALIAAILNGHAHLIPVLLQAGADLRAGTMYHENSVEAAAESSDIRFLEALLDATNSMIMDERSKLLGGSLCVAAARGNSAAIITLLEAGADPDSVRQSSSAIESAAQGKHHEVLSLLTNAGAKTQGRTLDEILEDSKDDIPMNGSQSDSDDDYDSEVLSLPSCTKTVEGTDSEMDDSEHEGHAARESLRSLVNKAEGRNVDIHGTRKKEAEKKERQRIVELHQQARVGTWS